MNVNERSANCSRIALKTGHRDLRWRSPPSRWPWRPRGSHRGSQGRSLLESSNRKPYPSSSVSCRRGLLCGSLNLRVSKRYSLHQYPRLPLSERMSDRGKRRKVTARQRAQPGSRGFGSRCCDIRGASPSRRGCPGSVCLKVPVTKVSRDEGGRRPRDDRIEGHRLPYVALGCFSAPPRRTHVVPAAVYMHSAPPDKVLSVLRRVSKRLARVHFCVCTSAASLTLRAFAAFATSP